MGLTVSAGEIADLAQGLAQVDLARRDDVFHTMRCILTHNLEEQAIFDLAFAAFWAGQRAWMMETEAGRRARTARSAAEENPPGKDVKSERIEDDAGEDLLLFPDPAVIEATVAAIVAAVATGNLTLERLQEAAGRVHLTNGPGKRLLITRMQQRRCRIDWVGERDATRHGSPLESVDALYANARVPALPGHAPARPERAAHHPDT
jgi:uncharacterized protein with von Willebrand factor type A (vWA) domain